ncbi:bifunctional homocysteine S-methyltransferase/methylenetetrahydrofolate reductase [Anaerobaca lacustris]|uniref:Bifunctional homocysteine S-methyltransferase/methylenetetrahydrofolate reductase n=1 Tax=Anaerobaca lacustris TaxID=3044600 RepID=A0AAW6TUE6_9BACT|nr:bifunctional homocysteine S-methyltransferase/methylenetetrahydrofolate reductase [Sedimentisphaerales bacterium M17dextr]
MDRIAFLSRVSDGVLIGDGAMGTMLYQRGVFLNRCFDELNLTDPMLVQGVHAAYVEAGADFVETNTFGANRVKLSPYGLADDVDKINRAAVEVARAAAGQAVLVAGAIGPLGCELTEFGPMTLEQARQIFRQQGAALTEADVDFLILETFSNSDELLVALDAVGTLADVAIVAQMTVNERNETIYGERVDQALSRIAAHDAVTAIGLNCAVGPSSMLSSLELVRGITDKPVSVQPNAGMPRSVEGRQLYMCTPEYMAEYAKRFFEKGARIIGGCCGTTPDHIREIARAVRSVGRAVARTTGSVTVGPDRAQEVVSLPAVPLQEKSQFGAKLAAGQEVTAVEMTPPRGVDMTTILERARQCAAAGIDAINIPDGPRASSRLSPMVTAVRIQREAGVETILHFCCRDRNLIGMQSDILGASAIGLKNLLIITGDPPKLGDYPNATAVFDMDSIALTNVVHNLNRGLDIGGNRIEPPTALTIGVGANPVAADWDREVERFRNKVAAGAEYAVTQPVFDADSLFRFLDAIEGFRIPVVAGIWPFTSFKNAEFMANEVPGVVVPKALLDRMSAATGKEQGLALGVQIARELVAKVRGHVAGFAVSAPFGNVRTALAVLE